MERTTVHEEKTKVTTHTGPAKTLVTETKVDKKAEKKAAGLLGPKKSVGTKIKEFFVGRKDDGIIYQNGLPIAGLNGPIVQPMGAPIRQPAEIHPVATVNTTPVTVGHIPGQRIEGPTTTTYGPAPPLEPGLPEGITMTTTHTEVIQPGIDIVQPMNAVAQPTGLGAIVQPAGIIIAGKDRRTKGLAEGYLKDRHVHHYPHAKVVKEEVTTTTVEEVVQPEPIVNPVISEPAPVIFTGPARVLEDKVNATKFAKISKHERHDYEQDHDDVKYGVNQYHTAGVGQAVLAYHQQPAPVQVPPIPVQPTYMSPTPGIQAAAMPPQIIQETNLKEKLMAEQKEAQQALRNLPVPNATVVTQEPVVLQQPGVASIMQPVVRNHEQVPIASHSGLEQGGMFQNDTAKPISTYTPVIQQSQPITAPIMQQAAVEQETFAPIGIRTKEGLVDPRPKGINIPEHSHGNKYAAGAYGAEKVTGYGSGYEIGQGATIPVGIEERKETLITKDVKY